MTISFSALTLSDVINGLEFDGPKRMEVIIGTLLQDELINYLGDPGQPTNFYYAEDYLIEYKWNDGWVHSWCIKTEALYVYRDRVSHRIDNHDIDWNGFRVTHIDGLNATNRAEEYQWLKERQWYCERLRQYQNPYDRLAIQMQHTILRR